MTRQLIELRAAVAAGAAESGAAVAAIGTSPLKVRPTPTDDQRYQRMTAEFGHLAREQLTCGQHVHVGIASRDEGAAVIDAIADWLPLFLALSANSPFWQGHDTGYASFRTVIWGLWPTAGPAGPFVNAAGYDAAVADLVRSGAALDDGMVYFDARLSAKNPTVEIRVADVCTDVRDAVLIAALGRALVRTTAERHHQAPATQPVPPQWRRAATWRAARYGLTGGLIDPSSRAVVPARQALASLIREIGDALDESGDRAVVSEGIERLLRHGTGAEQQRAAYSRTGSLTGVVEDAVRRTAQS